MKKLLKLITTILIITSLSSCLAVRSGKYIAVKPEDLKISSTKKPKVFISWDFYSSMTGIGNAQAINIAKSQQKKMLLDVMNESQCCEIVDTKENAEILVKGAFHNDSSSVGLIFAVVTGLSLYTIPSWLNSKMRISLTAESNKISKNYDIADSIFFAQWLPLIVVPIFTGNQFKVEGEVNKNLYKTLIVKMKDDGFFDKDLASN